MPASRRCQLAAASDTVGNLSFAAASSLRPSIASMAYCVLVAGEHWKTVSGEHNMGTNHCSMEHVGSAFDALRAIGVRRERIIVIAQIEERREWLRKAVASGTPRCISAAVAGEVALGPEAALEASRTIYRRKLATLERYCGRLIEEGGADYDGTLVNPETVVHVLTAALGDGPPLLGGPIVPRDCAGIALMIYSHGSFHETAAHDSDYWRHLMATTPCDVCGQPHPLPRPPAPAEEGAAAAAVAEGPQPDHEHVSLRTNEWYIHMPHSAPSGGNAGSGGCSHEAAVSASAAAERAAAERAAAAGTEAAPPSQPAAEAGEARATPAMYEGIAHAQHPHPYSLLYWQILFKIYHRRFTAAPSSPMLVLLNSCRSGGLTKFLQQEIVDQTYAVHDWPLYVMSSSQAERDAVVGGLWTSWFKRLADLSDDRHHEGVASPIAAATSSAVAGAADSMASFFGAVANEYNQATSYDLTNRLLASWQQPPGTDHAGLMGALRTSLTASEGRVIDYDALEQLVKRYKLTPRLNCITCKSFGRGGSKTGAGGGLLCSCCERSWVAAGNTEPPIADRGGAEADPVSALLEVAQQAEQQIARPWAWCGTRSEVGGIPLRPFLLGDAQPAPVTAETAQDAARGCRSAAAAAGTDADAKRQCVITH